MVCYKQCFTKFIKCLLIQQLTKLADSLRESGDFLSLLITLLLTVAGVLL